MADRKIPMRTCIGCRETKPKKELIRVVKSPDGVISLDLTGKKSGRGAYICHSLDCLQKARKARRLEKEFSCQIPEDVFERMKEELEKDEP